MSRPADYWKSLLLLALAPLCWAGNQVVGRGVVTEISPIALNFWRWAVAVAILAVVTGPVIAKSWPVIRGNWLKLLVLALCGASIFQTMIYWSLQHTTAINVLVLNSSLPIYMVAISWILLRDRVSLLQVIGGVISFAGVLVVLSGGSYHVFGTMRFGLGDLIVVVAMSLWALYSVLIKRWAPPLPALHLHAVVSAMGFACMVPLYVFDVAVLENSFEWTPKMVMAIAYVGVFGSVVGFIFWNIGVAHVGANIASFIYHLLPAYGTVLAILFLGERLKAFQVVGLALILGGVFLSATRGPSQTLPRSGTGA